MKKTISIVMGGFFIVLMTTSVFAGIQKGMDETLGIIQKQIHAELSKVADVSVIHPLVVREEINQLLGNNVLYEEMLSAGESDTAIFIFLDSCGVEGPIEMTLMSYEGSIYATGSEISKEEFYTFIDNVIRSANIETLHTQIIIGKLEKKGKDSGRAIRGFNAFPVRYDVINLDSQTGSAVLKETMEMIVERYEYE